MYPVSEFDFNNSYAVVRKIIEMSNTRCNKIGNGIFNGFNTTR